MRDQNTVRFTKMQLRCLVLSARYTTQEIAEQLLVGKKTVDFHLGNITDTLEVKTCQAAFERASQLHLIPANFSV